MKKITLFAICAVLLLTALAGCKDKSGDDLGFPNPGDGANSPGPDENTNTTDPVRPPAGGNVEGGLTGLIQKIYDNYENMPEVQAALAAIEENASRSEELGDRMNEIYGQLWADGVTEEEQEAFNAELAEIEAELAELREPESFRLPFAPAEPLTAEGSGFQSINWFLGDGNEDLPFSEGAVSEPMIGGGYSLVLLRMEAGANIEDAKNRLKNAQNGDQPLNWKWVCMGVDASDFIVDNIGDLLIVIISKRSAELHEAFLRLA